MEGHEQNILYGKISTINGDVYEGYIFNNAAQEFGNLVEANGNTYTGRWENGKK